MAARPPERFTELLHLRFTGALRDFRRVDKLKLASICSQLNLRSPEIYTTFTGASAIDLTALPDQFVIKPRDLASGRGVMLLSREPGNSGRYRDSVSGRLLSSDDIRKLYLKWQDVWNGYRPGKPFVILAQERIRGEDGLEAPHDYKLYTFNAQVKFIMQIERAGNGTGYAFFVNEFEAFDYSTRMVLNWGKNRPIQPIVPRCAAAMIEDAKRLSASLGTPFVRVDFYATDRGPVVGELTATPGTMYFSNMITLHPQFDAELGAAWIREAQNLNVSLPLFDDSETRKQTGVSRMPRKIA